MKDPVMQIPENIHAQVTGANQSHLFRFWKVLSSEQRQELLCQLEMIDWTLIHDLSGNNTASTEVPLNFASLEPPSAVRIGGSGVDWTLADAKERGEQALRNGEVGAVMVAGGQGTRLGFGHPKGMFPIGPLSDRSLFQIFADRLRATNRRYDTRIPLYLMTSDATHVETEAYFQSHDYLGLDSRDVKIFKQGTMPAVDAETGQCLLATKSSLALSPDGHGGTLAALERSGCFRDAEVRGLKQLAYIQVDNPLAQLCDPILLGHHLLAASEMTTQVVKKRYALERVGNVVRLGDRTQIVEYSDLPDHIATQTDHQGELRFWAGNIAVHVFDIPFLQRSLSRADSLPFHRAVKKVGYVDDLGVKIEPETPNAIKFERFIFDLLPSAKNALVVESDPKDSFAPVKNASGAATDTAELAREAVSELHRGWLRGLGITVIDDAKVEINPMFALDSAELNGKVTPDQTIATDHYFHS